MLPEIIVEFRSDKAKDKAKRDDAKKHSWRSKYYRILHIESYSETSIAHAMICNSDGELWFVDTRDLRVINTEDLMEDK